MSVGSNVRRYRQEAGLTQEQMASKATLAVRTVSRTESDDGEPTLATLNAIAGALGRTVADLVTDIETVGAA